MKPLLYILIAFCYCFTVNAQNGDRLNDIKGYRLKPGKAVFVYYRAADGSVNTTKFRTLNSSVFFVPFDPAVETTTSGKTYSLITVPGDQSRGAIPPQNGDVISSQDYNQLLWIEKDNLADKNPEFFKYRNDWVLGLLTAPFKYRPAIGDHASSAIDGSFNVGPYFGYKVRLSSNRPFFLNGVITGGPTSLTYTSANNSGITEKEKSETGFGFQYGGGVVFDLYKVQLGIIFACDHGVGDLSKTYTYQNNLWMAFSLSFNFLGNNANVEENKNK